MSYVQRALPAPANQSDTIEIADFARTLGRQWRAVIGFVVLGVLGALAIVGAGRGGGNVPGAGVALPVPGSVVGCGATVGTPPPPPAAAARCCCCAVALAAAIRASSSAARSGARPAHSRRRLTSRACEKYRALSTARPMTAANPA